MFCMDCGRNFDPSQAESGTDYGGRFYYCPDCGSKAVCEGTGVTYYLGPCAVPIPEYNRLGGKLPKPGTGS